MEEVFTAGGRDLCSSMEGSWLEQPAVVPRGETRDRGHLNVSRTHWVAEKCQRHSRDLFNITILYFNN